MSKPKIWLFSYFPELREAFDAFDTNKNGTICTKELGTIMQMLGNNPTDEEVKKVMEQVDANSKNSGIIHIHQVKSSWVLE